MKYSLGLDIGAASVGWALLDLERQKIADLGVRLFDGAENSKDGSSLAAPRREARGTRRRLRRRRQRMSEIRSLIVSDGLLTQPQIETLFSASYEKTPWELRTEGLDRYLEPEEWARVLLHIAKHRGFKSNRTQDPEEKTYKNTEEGRASVGIKANEFLLREGNDGRGYRTVGEMIQNDAKFAEHKRNKDGDYSNTVQRSDLLEEIKILFEAQRKFSNAHAVHDFEEKYIKIFSRQLPFAYGNDILSKVGNCTLEPSCKRASKATWTAERFVLLSKVVNLRVRVNGKKAELSIEQQKKILDMAYKYNKVTYKQIRKAFSDELGDENTFIFEKLPYVKKGNPEDAVFMELKAFHKFRKIITDALGKEYWETLISTKPTLLDTLGYALTYYKTDEDICCYLRENNVDEKLIQTVLPMNFSGNVNLSIEAMTKLIPFMESGFRYDEACRKANYEHKAISSGAVRSLKLSVLSQDEIRNPVVYRSITQTRKVVNAIVEKYGSPYCVQVELARDLSKNKQERREIEKRQGDNRNEKARLSEEFSENYKHRPSAAELDKYRLWKEQDGRCLYSGGYIDPQTAFMSGDGNYVEIDHIIPYSRSFDDSISNKALVFGSENRNKGNRTPYEYFGKDEKRWNEFLKFINIYIRNRKKASLLKNEDFGDQDSKEMKERSLSDTRWATKFVANWIENSLLFSDPENKKPVMRINGRATANLRWHWGVNALKDREASDLHHALDACVIAAATPGMIKIISDYSRRRELSELKKEAAEGKRSILPEPWKRFRKEVEARLSENPAEKIREYGLENYTEEDLASLKPVFISRKPDRRAHGAAHEETIRSAKYLDEGKTAVKTNLNKLTLESLEYMVGKERDKALYNALKIKLTEAGGNADKAFKDRFRKPTKDGTLGPVVRSIKIFSPGTSGIRVCNGIAANGGMVRVDVYRKNGKYYLIPHYVDDVAKGLVKNRAISANKEEVYWSIVDESYEFMFSLYKNDLIKVAYSCGEEYFGYYITTDRKNGSIKIDSPSEKISWRKGVKTAKLFEKYQVDVLGNYYKVKKEKPPHELAKCDNC